MQDCSTVLNFTPENIFFQTKNSWKPEFRKFSVKEISGKIFRRKFSLIQVKMWFWYLARKENYIINRRYKYRQSRVYELKMYLCDKIWQYLQFKLIHLKYFRRKMGNRDPISGGKNPIFPVIFRRTQKHIFRWKL